MLSGLQKAARCTVRLLAREHFRSPQRICDVERICQSGSDRDISSYCRSFRHEVVFPRALECALALLANAFGVPSAFEFVVR